MQLRATWNGKVIAESPQTVIVEGTHYFPKASLQMEYFSDNPKTTVCSWKGEASYYDITVDGRTNDGAAWYYPEPKSAAAEVAEHVAFWGGVEVTD